MKWVLIQAHPYWSRSATRARPSILRVYGVGQYRYHGADLGILMAYSRMRTDDRKLIDRAKLWNAGIKAQFEGVPPAPAAPAIPPDLRWMKIF